MDTINLLYFGLISEICGKNSEEINFSGKIDDLRNILIQKYPALLSVEYQFAVNQEVSSMTDKVSAGDEVALLPPFTGG